MPQYEDCAFAELPQEFKIKLCNSLAVAAVEDIIGTDSSEIWTLLGEEEPEDYDYDSDEHTDVIERATNSVSSELLSTLSANFEIFVEKIEEQDGLDSFWTCFLEKDQTDDIDEFMSLLQEVLEEIG